MVAGGGGTIQPLVEKSGNRLEVEIAEDLPPMHADMTKVRQSLFNLLSQRVEVHRARRASRCEVGARGPRTAGDWVAVPRAATPGSA